MRTLAVIPARGESKGLPRKNIYPFCGMPLIAHTIYYAQSCQCLDAIVVSTEDKEIENVALDYGVGVLERPLDLAQDDIPIWYVLRHVLAALEGTQYLYDYVVLLETTSPLRRLGEMDEALQMLGDDLEAEGLMSVAQYQFNPLWNGFISKQAGGSEYLDYLVPEGSDAWQRQQVKTVYHHSGDFYIFRAKFLRENRRYQKRNDGSTPNFLFYRVPEFTSFSIDTREELEWAEQLVLRGLVDLPWVKKERL